jgi:hypothetical protein
VKVDDFYTLLGVDPLSSPADIRKAWLELAHRHHPDHNPGNPSSHDLFISIKEAYSVLSNPDLRRLYDQQRDTFSLKSTDSPYLKVSTDSLSAEVYQEVRVHFTYLGNGMAFSKPSMNGFKMASKPYVSHKMVGRHGDYVKETTLTYVIVPQRTGNLEISSASIMISGKRYATSSLTFTVASSKCAFTGKERADAAPVRFEVFRILPAKQGRFPLGETKVNHLVWIPRGRTAYMFHSLGMALKVVFTFFGGFWLLSQFNMPFLLGACVGNLAGGLNVRIMYHLVSVKPKWEGSRAYARRQEYLGYGFFEGEGFFWPLIKNGLLSRIIRAIL